MAVFGAPAPNLLTEPMQDEPLVYTIKGNLPTSALRLETLWEDTEDYVKCQPHYYLIETGELVRNDCYVLDKKGFVAAALQGTLG